MAGEVRRPRPLLRPMVKLVANIHGDEVVGRELLIALARCSHLWSGIFRYSGTHDPRYLTENYSSDGRVRQLVDTTDIFLVPSLNPDGYEEEDRCRGSSVIYMIT